MDVLYVIAVVIGIIGVVVTRKAKFEAAKQYYKMKYTLDEMKRKEAANQTSHTRYGS